MKKIIYTILTVLLLTFSALAQTAVKAGAVLHVEVENGKTLDLTVADLAKLTRLEIKAKDHDEKIHTFSGVSLVEVLKLADAKLGKDEVKGKTLAKILLVEAADGYKATFAIAELASDFTDRIILLADMSDGKPLDEKTGHWQIVVPDEKKHGRWVRQVISLKLKTAQ